MSEMLPGEYNEPSSNTFISSEKHYSGVSVFVP